MTQLLSDARLARRASDGDRRAFAAIYERYHQDIYRFCLSIVRRSEDAEDALQGTMAKALAALPGERREIQLKAWLYRVAHNESIDLLRRRREGPELEDERLSSGPELAETAAQRERLRRLFADLDELPERQRSALVMRELGGLGYEQIGEAFESSAAVARQTVYEARLGLRELEAGREMSCERVTRQLSEADGRVARRRDIRAHLRACPDCRAFRDSIESRQRDLQALASLPLAAAASILHGILGGKLAAGGGLGGAVTAAGAGAGKAAGTSVAIKAVATVAVVATVGVTAADRSGLVDVGLPGSGKNGSGKEVPAAGEGAEPAAAVTGGVEARQSAPGREGIGAAAQVGPGQAQAGASNPAATTPTARPAESSQPGQGGGDPANSPAASRHGQETAAEHRSTNRGKAIAKGKQKTHPTPPQGPSKNVKGHKGSSAGGQSKGKAKGQQQPKEDKPEQAHPVQAEAPGKAKSEAPEEASTERGKGSAEEPETTP